MDIDLTPTGECWEDALLLGIDLHNRVLLTYEWFTQWWTDLDGDGEPFSIK